MLVPKLMIVPKYILPQSKFLYLLLKLTESNYTKQDCWAEIFLLCTHNRKLIGDGKVKLGRNVFAIIQSKIVVTIPSSSLP